MSKINEHIMAKLDPPLMTPREIASMLMRDCRLPSFAFYTLPPNSACWWATFSSDESKIRKQYEADVFHSLRLGDYLYKSAAQQHVGVIGLAVGEGMGEIEILKRILKDLSPSSRVDYLAIDMSPPLLLVHLNLLRDVFAAEIQTGRLNLAVMLGNIKDLKTSLKEACQEFKSRGIAFLPEGMPLLITCLGNVLGNESEVDQEVSLIKDIQRIITNRRMAFVVGISVIRETVDTYDPAWIEFLMVPLRYLVELSLLVSEFSDRQTHADAEFYLNQENQEECKKPLVCTRRNYEGRYGNRLETHQFYYSLRHDLKMPVENLILKKRSKILLYSVTKYDVEGLAKAIENIGVKVRRPDRFQVIQTAEEIREYAVIAATS